MLPTLYKATTKVLFLRMIPLNLKMLSLKLSKS
jgi:hypothetical protein